MLASKMFDKFMKNYGLDYMDGELSDEACELLLQHIQQTTKLIKNKQLSAIKPVIIAEELRDTLERIITSQKEKENVII